MTKEDRILLEGYRAAAEGAWCGENPYPLNPERTWWQDGFRCFRPANDTAPLPANDTGPAPVMAACGATR